MNHFDYINEKQKMCKEEYNKGIRIGVGIMLLFIVSPLLLILTTDFLPRWIGIFTFLFIWISIIFWLTSKNSNYEEKLRVEYEEKLKEKIKK